jgi:hypothetical protein
MEVIEIQTLIDITNTGVIRPNQGTQLAHDQYRNFVTLRQCIELRSIVSFDSKPESKVINIKNMGFGSDFKGEQKVWIFKFVPDRVDVYKDELGNPIGNLIDDMDSVPIIKNLSETVNIERAIFNCKDPFFKNTIIKAHKGTL